jgi:RNA polymerase sigma-70 factor (TIGR02960 family)
VPQSVVIQDTLTRAQAGDEQAFRELTAPYHRELQLHCYRMLGSLTDAEDALQETMLAAWRGLPGYEGRASLRTWLYRIATNRCLNAIRDGRGRVSMPTPKLPFQPPEPSDTREVTWLQPYPDTLLDPQERYEARETVELAFVAATQRLPPRQAAAVVLRDVLGFSTPEVASMLDTSEVAVKRLLGRARSALAHRRPDRRAAPAPDSPEERRLTRRFADAFIAGDVDGVVALLTDDAWLSMPPAPHQYHGPRAVAAFLRVTFAARPGPVRLRPIRTNTQPAFGCYRDGTPGEPTGIVVLTLAGNRIHGLTKFLEAELLPRFGLLSDDLAEGSATETEGA